ncbi:MAG: hypothetical protein NWE84_04345 [Candidatus Bathyarchaeota archaeon]|nr:hypothetical protein [Candidatus Bathyarchaeota archaeon]
MEPHLSELQVLKDLGLTLVQAKVYLTLLKIGPSKTSKISKISKVAQPDTYRALKQLQEKNLVQEIVKKPHEYMATPADTALSLMLETKTQQFDRVRTETQLLRDRLKKEQIEIVAESEVPQLVMIPKGRIVIERVKTAIAQTQQSMDLVLSWKRFSRGIVDTFAESLETAWAKKVKIRFIVESPSESETAEQLIQFCKNKPHCQMKFILDHPAVILGIYDKKETFIIINPDTDLPGSPTLWSNNSSIITLVDEYFKMLWLTAMEQPNIF